MIVAKLGLVFAVILAGVSAAMAADQPKVQISSFAYVDADRRVAEICGKVTGTETPTLVRLNVDYTGRNPAAYHVTAGKDGLFCTLVLSMRGTVQAGLDAAPAGSTVAATALERPAH